MLWQYFLEFTNKCIRIKLQNENWTVNPYKCSLFQTRVYSNDNSNRKTNFVMFKNVWLFSFQTARFKNFRFPLRYQTEFWLSNSPSTSFSARHSKNSWSLLWLFSKNSSRSFDGTFSSLRIFCLCWFFSNVSDFLPRSCQIDVFIGISTWLCWVLGVTRFRHTEYTEIFCQTTLAYTL